MRFTAAVLVALVASTSTNHVDAFCCRGVQPLTTTTSSVVTNSGAERKKETIMMAVTTESPSMLLPSAVEFKNKNVIKMDGGRWPSANSQTTTTNSNTLGFELKLSPMPSAPGGSDALEDGGSSYRQRRSSSSRQRRHRAPREPLIISPTEYMRIPALKTWIPTIGELEDKNIEELQEMCILRGLSKDGSTEELQDRLQQLIMRQRSNQQQRTSSSRSSMKSISESFLYPDSSASTDATTTPSSSSSSSAVPDSLQAWRRSKKQEMKPEQQQDDEAEDAAASVEDWNQAWAQRSVEERKKRRSSLYGNYADLDDDDDVEPMSEMEALSKTEEILERGAEIDRMLAEDENDDDIEAHFSEEDEDERYEAWAKIREEQLLRRSEELLDGYGFDLFEDDADYKEEAFDMTVALEASQDDDANNDLMSTWKELYERGQVEHALGNVAAATRLFKAGLKLEPSNSKLHMAMGDVYRGAVLYHMSQMSYHRALKYAQEEHDEKELEQQSIQAMMGLAYVAYEKRNEDESRHYLKMAALASTSSPQPWMTWARFEEAQGDVDKAKSIMETGLEELESSLLLSSSSSSTAAREDWIAFFDNWLRLECATDGEDVDSVFRRAVGFFPNQWTFYDALASHYYGGEKTEKAREFYKIAMERSRWDDNSDDSKYTTVDPIRHYAQDKMAEGNYEEARSILSSVMAKEEVLTDEVAGLQEFYFVYAICEWHLGDLIQATELFEMAVASSSSSSSALSFIHYGRASLEVVRGNLILAQHFLGLAWKESSMSTTNNDDEQEQNHKYQIWKLWKRIATQLNQQKLVDECQLQMDRLQSQNDYDDALLRRLLPTFDGDDGGDNNVGFSLPRTRQDVMDVLTPISYLEQDPWSNELVPSSNNHFTGTVKLPELPPPVVIRMEEEEEEEEGKAQDSSHVPSLERTVKNGRSKY